MSRPTTERWIRYAQGVLWGFALLVLALAWAFPDAIARLRAWGSTYAEAAPGCDLDRGPCTARFPDGTEVRLRATPHPVGPDGQVHLWVEAPLPPRTVEIYGIDMAMGLVRAPLAPALDAEGWTARVTLPACTSKRMRWRADVLFDDRIAGFTLVSTRP